MSGHKVLLDLKGLLVLGLLEKLVELEQPDLPDRLVLLELVLPALLVQLGMLVQMEQLEQLEPRELLEAQAQLAQVESKQLMQP
jgi:hypothetical protein